MENKAIVIFSIPKRNFQTDMEVPLDITANNLVLAMNAAYDLGIDTADMKNCFLVAENPISLIKGNKSLSELGIRNGTVISYTE